MSTTTTTEPAAKAATPVSSEDRNSRQASIIPLEKLKSGVTVIGVGAIGRQVALQLAAIGVQKIQIIDFDTVEAANLGPQGYFESDIGLEKVAATGRLMARVNPNIELDMVSDRFKKSTEVHDVVFCCVDKMDARKFIYETLLARKAKFFVDGRMAAEVLRVVTAHDADTWDYYQHALFDQGEAFTGSCTAKSTIFCANVAAGFMVQAFSKWLRRMPIDNDIMLNMLSMEIAALDERPKD